MKNKKKLLFSAIAMIALCLSIVAGATFAMFTDESTTSMTITGGKVDLEVEILPESLKAYSSKWNRDEEKYEEYATVCDENGVAYFYAGENLPTGGSVKATKTNVAVSKMAPLDRISFEMNIVNKSNIAVVYRIYILKEDGTTDKNLAEKLQVTFQHNDMVNTDTGYSYESDSTTWTEIAPQTSEMNNGVVENVKVNVLFPAELGNEYQEGECTMTFIVEAYQAYAKLNEQGYVMGVRNWLVSSETGFDKVADLFNDGDTITLLGDDKWDTVEIDTDKAFNSLTLTGSDIGTLNVNIPNGALHVYNKCDTVNGTNVDMNSAYFYNEVGTLNATAGHFVIAETAKVENIVVAETTEVLPLVIDIKGEVKDTLAVEAKAELNVAKAAKVNNLTVAETATETVIKNEGKVEQATVKAPATIQNFSEISVVVDTKEEVKIENAEEAVVVLETTEDAQAVTLNGTEVAANVTVEKSEVVDNYVTTDGKVYIQSAAGLKEFRDAPLSNVTVILLNDIDLTDVEWGAGIDGNGKNIIFDGNGKTIKNLTAIAPATNDEDKMAGFFANGYECTIKNTTFDNAKVIGVNHVGVVCGRGRCVIVENCTIKNSSVKGLVVNNDDGDKIGAVVGFLSGEPVAKIVACTVENVTVQGYRDLGGLTGYASGTFLVKDNTVNNVTITCDKTINYKNYTTDAQFDANEVIGEATADGKSESNTYENVVIKSISPVVVKEDQTLQTAVNETLAEAKEGDVISIPQSDEAFKIPTIGQNVSLVGQVNEKGEPITEVNSTGSGSIANVSNGATFENMVFSFGNTGYHGFQHQGGVVTFKNCILKGLLVTYGNMEFIDCTFINDVNDAYCVQIYGGENFTFTNCTFNGVGKNVYLYQEGLECDKNVTFTDCKFNIADNTVTPGDTKSGVMLNSSNNYNGHIYNVVINNCTTTQYANTTAAVNEAGKTNYQGLYGLKHKNGNGAAAIVMGRVTVDGEVVYEKLN